MPLDAIKAILEDYRNNLLKRNYRISSVRSQLKRLRTHLPKLGSDLREVTRNDLIFYLVSNIDGWTLEYFKKVRVALIDFFAWLNRARLIDHNIAANFPPVMWFTNPDRMKSLGYVLGLFDAHLITRGVAVTSRRARVADIERLSGTVSVLEATDVQLARYVNKPSWSVYYRKRVRSSLRVFYKWAYETGFVTDNPALSIATVRGRCARPQPISDSDLLAGFNRAPLQIKVVIALAGSLGLRRSEITQLHSRHRRGRNLTVHGKGNVVRVIPLNDLTFELLVRLERMQGKGFYFPNREGSGPVHHTWVYKNTKPYIGSWTLHSLRHRAATVGLNSNNTIRAVQEFLGHASVATTQVYTHVTIEQLRALSEATARAFTGAEDTLGELRGEISGLCERLDDSSLRMVKAMILGLSK